MNSNLKISENVGLALELTIQINKINKINKI